MKSYDNADPNPGPVRSHPWIGAANDPESRYFDFRKHPELIRTALEDLRPWRAWAAIETFYQLLEWINGADSILESNDCAFAGPHRNETPQFAKALEATGRVMVLWRHLPLNLPPGPAEWLRMAIHHALNRADPEFVWGVVGITVFQARYLTLGRPHARPVGFQLMLSFWSWGDTDEEVMTNLDRTFRNLRQALGEADREARESIADGASGV